MMNNNIDHIVWACPDLITTPELPDVMKICSWVGINADFAEAKEPSWKSSSIHRKANSNLKRLNRYRSAIRSNSGIYSNSPGLLKN